MRWPIVIVFVCFAALLGAPFLFRPAQPPPPADALRLIIITPHNEQIRTEFGRAFDEWLSAHFDEWDRGSKERIIRQHLGADEADVQRWLDSHDEVRVKVEWNVPGGTSEIRTMLEAQYKTAIEAGRAPGGDADLVFGGGSYEHNYRLKAGVLVGEDDNKHLEPISAPVDFDENWLEAVYGENDIGGTNLYDPDRQWFGTALSGFGIVYNRDVLARIGVDDPTYWQDLCNPALRGWVAAVNPGQSGSITTAFDAILQRRGWERGWQILRRASANARYFSGSSLKPPTDVSQGNAAMGVCIDFYGRYQSQAMGEAGDPDRLGYVDPPKVSTIDPDPISMLRGAPHPELAKRFIEFCLTHEGQSLWQFRVDDPIEDHLGPQQFELRRMPVLRSMYAQHFDRLIDQVNPFELAEPVENPVRDIRSFIAIIFAAMSMDNHYPLREAWNTIVTHPAYPAYAGIVSAEDVDDPQLRAMLEAFDAMPVVRGPDDSRYPLDTPEHLKVVKSGWLRDGWKNAGLWHPHADPQEALRREFAAFFGGQYDSILTLARASREGPVVTTP